MEPGIEATAWACELLYVYVRVLPRGRFPFRRFPRCRFSRSRFPFGRFPLHFISGRNLL